MNKSIVTQGQNILDKAMEMTGSIEGAFDIALMNGVSITDDRKIGDEICAGEILTSVVVAIFKNRPLSTSLTVSDKELLNNPCGIEFWVIEGDFVVS